MLGRNEVNGRCRVETITTADRTAAYVYCDAKDRDSVRLARDEAQARLGQPTILINAAGGNSPNVTVTEDRPFEAIELEDW